jgi:hypothetical protein
MVAVAARLAYFSWNAHVLGPYLANQGLSQGALTEDITVYGDLAEEFIGTILTAGGFDMEGIWDSTVDGWLGPELGTTEAFEFGPAGNGGGNVKLSGDGVLDRFDIKAPVKGIVRFTAHVKPTGTISRGTF